MNNKIYSKKVLHLNLEKRSFTNHLNCDFLFHKLNANFNSNLCLMYHNIIQRNLMLLPTTGNWHNTNGMQLFGSAENT